ncbi:FHA domain-containing protein, partial [Mycobacterium simiae]|uniref:FHA domain-containing protein n=1 Tax=Mycobacterium simiae TaxID=1784 RepID=UPI00111C80AF
MSRPALPVLTVRYEGSERTFAPGNDVVIGRDLRADVRVAHPLISRIHLLVRFDQGRWIAIDNGSLNGLYVNNRRVPAVEIQDGQRINIGNPDGPALTFEVGRHQGSAGTPPPTTSIPLINHTSDSRPGQGRPP